MKKEETKITQLKKLFLGQEKNFSSGHLIFENWSGGPVDLFLFFEPQHKSSKSYFSTSLET